MRRIIASREESANDIISLIFPPKEKKCF